MDCAGWNGDFYKERELSEMDFSAFYQVPATFEAEGFQSAVPGVKSVFLSGPKYQGKETRVFAWYCVPETAASDVKVPGIVLVHGGLGTAFAGWVKRWNDRGYAAIAIDIFGGLPAKDGSYCTKNPPERHEFSGPDPEKKFEDTDSAPEEQWPYHAVAAIISAGSFLASLPGVDAGKIGLTGISWGGYAVALAAGYDDRFRFVMPVYGCGGFESGLKLIPEEASARKVRKFASLWDPDNTLAKAKMPILWVNGASDMAFDVFNWNRSSGLSPRSFRSLRPMMVHGQHEGEAPPELEAFAETVLAGRDFPRFVRVIYNGDTVQLGAKWQSPVKIAKADIAWTRASGCWNDCLFRTAPAKLNRENNSVTGDLPSDWTAAYLILRDEAGLIYTSEVIFSE